MLRAALFAVLIAALGCSFDSTGDPSDPTGPGNPGDPGEPGDPDDPAEPGAPSIEPPADCDPAPSVQEVWDHDFISPAVTALGSGYHGSADAITNPGVAVNVSARFVYGVVVKDLEDETVIAYIETGDCQWQRLGDVRTDDDGVATFSVPGAMLSKAGAYNIELVVRGDDTRTRSAVWVIEPGTDVVVFDIDGTLTTGDSELFQEILLGDEPEMYEAANQVVSLYRDATYLPIFITGRPMYLDIMTRQWLSARGLPVAPLQLTEGLIQAALSVEEYKRETLVDLRDRVGADLRFAYGNASTDVCAYATAGIDPAETFIIGENRGSACSGFEPTVAVLDYPSHLADLTVPAPEHGN